MRKEEMMLETTEMQMLRPITGVTLRDKKMNEIRKGLGLCVITVKARENRLCWFRYLHRADDGKLAKDIIYKVVDGKRGWGRSRTRWKDNVKRDMRELSLTVEDEEEREQWRRRIQATNPDYLG